MADRDDDRWFLVDATQLAFPAMRREMAERQKVSRSPAAVSSARFNLARTQALIKVPSARSWRPGAGAVLRAFVPVDHSEAAALTYTADWLEDTGGPRR